MMYTIIIIIMLVLSTLNIMTALVTRSVFQTSLPDKTINITTAM